MLGWGLACLVLGGVALLAALIWAMRRYELVVRAPISADVTIEGPLLLSVDVPIQMVLTEREIDLNQLEVPLDTALFIDDEIHLETTMPVHTQVATPLGITVPVKADVSMKASVPIKQTIHVRDRLRLNMDSLRIPIRATVPVQLRFSIEQTVRVSTTVDVPVRLDALIASLRARSK